ncbi:hypothetical protein NQ317_018195 [Molorchus minor]|uniref:Mitogen-activated protein kinase kinase kinase N-terminal domain-containing protein n=1 Tax=Molorchus minor TaxID=1323400 RepID=A0ABQ9JY48_9CUCU|nr:hypothetical protein NQ317_018195 [Molorchus minor]
MGCKEKPLQERNPRRAMSREETLWQNELKDLIWLELQAYHERTPTEEDLYLCTAREMVEPLLNDIKNYKFQRHTRRYSTQTSDSGVEEDCSGCLSTCCGSCLDSQNEALRDVENLLKRLEDAENLFPSSKAFAELYPLYKSTEIVGRVKSYVSLVQHDQASTTGKLALLGDDISSSSASDSNNSSNSSSNDFFSYGKNNDCFLIPLLLAKRDEKNVSPYRRYIENILKTRTLDKSFLRFRRRRAGPLRELQPRGQSPRPPILQIDISFPRQCTIRSYTRVLVDVLNRNPKTPPPKCKTLDEGTEGRFTPYLVAATAGTTEKIESYTKQFENLTTVLLKFSLTIWNTLERWALLHHNTFQKNLLEEEFQFSCEIIRSIPNGKEMLSTKFSYILGCILRGIGVKANEENRRCSPLYLKMMRTEFVFRYVGNFSRCSTKREMSLKAMAFSKTIAKYDSRL